MANVNSVEARSSWTPWWLVLIWGIAAILMGILLFMRPAATVIILIQFLGIYWLITGIFSIVSLLWDRVGWGWKLFNGILGIIAGLLIIQNPLWSTLLVPVTLAIMVGIIGIVIGILQLFAAFRGGGWGVGILGVLSILLGFLLIARPVIAGLTLPWVLGGLLIFGGVLAFIGSFGLRRAEHEVAEEQARMANQGTRTAGAAGLAAAGYEAAKSSGEEVEVDEVEVDVVEEAPEETTQAADDAVDLAEAAGAGAAASAGAMAASGSAQTDEAVESMPDEVSEAVLTGNVNPNDPEEMAKFKHPLEYVEGIGPVYAGHLQGMGLVTCLDLLKAGATRKGREAIADKSGISGKLVLEWVNHVDLYRIRGVGQEYADLLEAAGVDTVVELAQRNPDNLFEKISEVNAEKELVRKLPTAEQVIDWVTQAKDLPRMITY
ncbi:MAG: DUF4332 domain-containing protein [Anaerolineales bacterium]